ncbi:MAG: hypothetical protein JHC78_07190 [Ilumatobacteraceae bacterium]|nr:hypothetical protein [Ilumatobacteraceae bacterium]
MHDIADLELRGIPSMFVASAEFVTAATSQSLALGFPDIKRVFTTHPIQDRTNEEMQLLADKYFAEILACITEQES